MTGDADLAQGALTVRPMGEHDGDRLVRFHERLDEHSQYLRFFTAHPHLSPAEVHRFTHVDHHDREAFVVTDGDEIVGVGRYDRLPDPTVAEVAFVVAQPWRGHGLATMLLHRLADHARAAGITTFLAETLGCNSGMRQVFAHAGFPSHTTFRDGAIETTLDITDVADVGDA